MYFFLFYFPLISAIDNKYIMQSNMHIYQYSGLTKTTIPHFGIYMYKHVPIIMWSVKP